MELEKQVCSLDLAKKLKELGVKKEAIHYWWEDTYGMSRESQLHPCLPNNPQGGWTVFAAFTVAELGEMLPYFIHQRNVFVGQLVNWKNPHEWSALYGTLKDIFHKEEAFTEADARAKMLIYLLENKLVDAPNVRTADAT